MRNRKPPNPTKKDYEFMIRMHDSYCCAIAMQRYLYEGRYEDMPEDMRNEVELEYHSKLQSIHQFLNNKKSKA